MKNENARLETIFRTNVQRAYQAGRYEQMTHPVTLKMRPYWLFDAILDGRTTRGCKDANGTLLPAKHPWWDGNYPPRHFRCRSLVRSLRVAEAEKRGITAQPPDVTAQDGFGALPSPRAEYNPLLAKLEQA